MCPISKEPIVSQALYRHTAAEIDFLRSVGPFSLTAKKSCAGVSAGSKPSTRPGTNTVSKGGRGEGGEGKGEATEGAGRNASFEDRRGATKTKP